MSIANAILSFAIILEIIINLLFPAALGPIVLSPIFWFFKGIGAFIIVIGIVTIAISQVKAHLLIYLTGSGAAENILTKLEKVKGITSISAVSGELLLIATLKIRSLGKAYRTLVTDLEKIEGIKKVVTLTNIKEWEKL